MNLLYVASIMCCCHNRSTRGSAILDVRDSATIICPYVYTLHACIVHESIYGLCNTVDIWDLYPYTAMLLFMSISIPMHNYTFNWPMDCYVNIHFMYAHLFNNSNVVPGINV